MRHTVIVSSYNRPNMLRQALNSVFDSGWADLEVIVADDGSVDEVKRAISEYPVIHIDFSDDNRMDIYRYSIGINRAIKIATGDIFHYLPDDDLFHRDRFSNVDAFMSGDIMVGYGRCVYFNDINNISWGTESARFPDCDISPKNKHPEGGLLDHGQVFHKRDCFNMVSGWKEINQAMDCLFFTELSSHYKFYPMNKTVNAKRSHEFNLLKLKTQKGGIKE